LNPKSQQDIQSIKTHIIA